MAKRTRHRQLAKQAARRQAEKRQRQRRRQLGTIAVAVVVAMVGSVLVFVAFAGNGEEPDADATPTGSPTASPTTSPTEDLEPGSQIGTVEPEPGPETVACGAEAPAGALEPKPQFNAPADVTRRNRTYTATFETSCGDVVVELLLDRAPETVNSFVFLAQQGFFDGTRIHRLDTSIDVIQGGDPTGSGIGGPGYTIPDELTGDESYETGVLAMANSGTPDSGGSQFFVITGENGLNLDANPAYTIFGEVVEGLDVAQEIQALQIQDPAGGIGGQQPAEAVYIQRVTIQESR